MTVHSVVQVDFDGLLMTVHSVVQVDFGGLLMTVHSVVQADFDGLLMTAHSVVQVDSGGVVDCQWLFRNWSAESHRGPTLCCWLPSHSNCMGQNCQVSVFIAVQVTQTQDYITSRT